MRHRTIKIGLLLFLTSVLWGACITAPFEIPFNKVDCYFQYEYVIYAWGFNHSGYTITPSGEIYTFDKTTPWVFASNNQLSLSALQNNIKASARKDTLIKSADIEYYQHFALDAMAGTISDPLNRGADMGLAICKILVPDPATSPTSYKEVILTQTGDTEVHNLAPEAALIAAWLMKMR